MAIYFAETMWYPSNLRMEDMIPDLQEPQASADSKDKKQLKESSWNVWRQEDWDYSETSKVCSTQFLK